MESEQVVRRRGSDGDEYRRGILGDAALKVWLPLRLNEGGAGELLLLHLVSGYLVRSSRCRDICAAADISVERRRVPVLPGVLAAGAR